MKKILFSLVAAVLALGAMAQNTSQVRIYINPGHGSWGGEDRHMGTVTHGGPTYTDTAGFYESNTNLEKGFGMLEKLIEYGIETNDKGKKTLVIRAKSDEKIIFEAPLREQKGSRKCDSLFNFTYQPRVQPALNWILPW
jgi:hypothetical protein